MHLSSVIILFSLISCFKSQVIIEEHPLSLSIPVNELAVFTCKGKCERRCSNVYWVINGTDANYRYGEPLAQFVQMGFTFSRDQESQYIYNTTLTVNATKAVNNTDVSCVFEDHVTASNHSLNATLKIIAATDSVTDVTAVVTNNMDTATESISNASEASVLVMYRVVLGICLSVIAILLVVVLILTTYAIHLYRHRFKRRPGMRLKDTKPQSYNNMVHNPIYAGLNSPVYDSIWTRALEESLGTDGNKVPSTADRQFNATPKTNKKCSHSMSTEYAPNKVQHDESLHW